jgi:OOP family OmpA-OmpF porin
LNQLLSQARADAVLDALMVRGVPLDRLSARGYGEEQPVASNENEAGRALNRRIEFSALE